MTQFYTYVWLRQKDSTPYYVGKGYGRRAFIHHGVNRRPRSKHMIIVQHWESEDKAFEMEKWWIALYGRNDLGTGILHNQTEGGDGVSGRSEESLRKLADSRIGAKATEETKNKMSAAHKKRYAEEPRTEETRRKLRESGKRRDISYLHTPEIEKKAHMHRKGSSSTHKGVHFCKPNRNWKVMFYIDGKMKYFGCFPTEEEAAKVANAIRAERDSECRSLYSEVAAS